MALINCKKCGNQISELNVMCPFCWEPVKEKGSGALMVYIGIPMALILIIFFLFLVL